MKFDEILDNIINEAGVSSAQMRSREKAIERAEKRSAKARKQPKQKTVDLANKIDELYDELELKGLADEADEIVENVPPKEVWKKYGSIQEYQISQLEKLLSPSVTDEDEDEDEDEEFEIEKPDSPDLAEPYLGPDEFKRQDANISGMRRRAAPKQQTAASYDESDAAAIEILKELPYQFEKINNTRYTNKDLTRALAARLKLDPDIIDTAGLGQLPQNYTDEDVWKIMDERVHGKFIDSAWQPLYMAAVGLVKQMPHGIFKELSSGIHEAKLRLKDDIIIERNGVVDVIPAGSLICENIGIWIGVQPDIDEYVVGRDNFEVQNKIYNYEMDRLRDAFSGEDLEYEAQGHADNWHTLSFNSAEEARVGLSQYLSPDVIEEVMYEI